MLKAQLKELLKLMKSFECLDFSQTPTFSFCHICTKEMNNLGLDEWTDVVLGNIKIELPTWSRL
jgi:hypothetical protein